MRPSVEGLEARELLAHLTILSQDGGSSGDLSGTFAYFPVPTQSPFHVSGSQPFPSALDLRSDDGFPPAVQARVGATLGGILPPGLAVNAYGSLLMQHVAPGVAETIDANLRASGQLTLRIDPDAGEKLGDFVMVREDVSVFQSGTTSVQWSATPNSAPGTYLVRIGDTLGATVHVTASVSGAYSFFSVDPPIVLLLSGAVRSASRSIRQ
jgi:hypothetical protein